MIEAASAQLPKFENPMDPDDSLFWAAESRHFTNWLRENGAALGVDPEKTVLGFALSDIIGDDANCFGKSTGYIPEFAEGSRKDIIERLSWELTVVELPVEIRSRIADVLGKFEAMTFNYEPWFYYARYEWVTQVRDFTERAIKKDPVLEDALQYRHDVDYILNKDMLDEIMNQGNML